MVVMCNMIYAISHYKRNFVRAIADGGDVNFVVMFVLTSLHYLK